MKAINKDQFDVLSNSLYDSINFKRCVKVFNAIALMDEDGCGYTEWDETQLREVVMNGLDSIERQILEDGIAPEECFYGCGGVRICADTYDGEEWFLKFYYEANSVVSFCTDEIKF